MRLPDGEIAESAALPCALEFPPPAAEFPPPCGGALGDPRLELTPPPPEYPQCLTTTEEPAKKKTSRWAKLAAAALISAMSFGFFGDSISTTVPNAEPVPGEEISETGDVQILLRYAELRENTVHYSYYPFLPDPDDPEIMSGDIPLPINVYARVTDEYGGSAAPVQEPDVWMFSRGYLDYEIDAQGLRGDLTLTLTALYTQDGKEKKTTLSVPIEVKEADEDVPTIDIMYALTDGETVFFGYYVNIPRNELGEENEAYWPVTVHPTAESESGQIYYGEEDVWEYSRASQFAYEFQIWDAGTNELTLKLNAEYEYDGEHHTILATAPIEPMPQAESFAFLYVLDDGTADFKAAFTTSADDDHFYDLEPMMLWAEAYDSNHQNLGGFWNLQDLSELVYESFEESESKEYVLHRMDTIGEWPENAKYCRFRFYVRDRSTGYIYQMESNLAQLPAKTYPLGDEIIEITVYNDTLTYEYASLTDDPGWVTVLMHTQMNAADFTDFELPFPLVPVNYQSTGYVVFFGSPYDNGYDAYEDYGGPLNEPPAVTEDFSGEAPVEAYISKAMFAFPLNGLTLTKAMVERVPIAEDGVRYVNIHATWKYIGADPEFYVELDDGEGNITLYPVSHPLASEGFFCTITFPQPMPPMGCFFDGWYDENGKRVEFLIDYFSFTPYLYDENGNYVDYDWSSEPNTVRLIAHWEPY